LYRLPLAFLVLAFVPTAVLTSLTLTGSRAPGRGHPGVDRASNRALETSKTGAAWKPLSGRPGNSNTRCLTSR
jgi:hypothetical protein